MQKILTTLTILFYLNTMVLLAIPARRVPMTFTQPDGTTITIALQGDEYFHYYATTDGIMVAKGTDGYYYYANLTESGNIEVSSILAHNKGERTASDFDFINKINDAVMNKKITTRFAKSNRRSPLKVNEVPNNGSPRVLVLLIQYSDIKFSEGDQAKTNYIKRISQKNYTEGRDYGSVRDYFLAQSRGKFDPQFDIIGPVTLDNKREYYGGNDRAGNDLRPGEMIEDACNKAKEEGLIPDFSVYDNNNDKYVDVVYTLYAGVGEASSDETKSIWPHQWQLDEALGKTITIDGVKINKYACNNELYGKEIDGIGTFCHEFSHCLGLPDFYDTTSSGSNFGMNSWSLMDYGSYNDDGHTPCGYSSYERAFMGWLDIATLENPSSIELKALNTDEGEAYRISNSNNANEYFLLENRQLTGWDSALSGHGMLVIHVDYSASVWNDNTVNNSASHQRMTLLPADGKLSIKTLSGDPYPGTNKVSSISSFKVYSGSALDKPITNIAETADGTITFNFMEGVLTAPLAKKAQILSTTSFIANWEPVENADSYTLEYKKYVAGDLLLNEDFSKFTKGSESTPDATDVSTKLNDLMLTAGWSGYKVFQAGEVCKLGSKSANGYLVTPSLDLSQENGSVSIVLKAKGKNAATNALKISLSNNTNATNPADSKSFDLTTNMNQIVCVLNSNLSIGYLKIQSSEITYIDDIFIYSGDYSGSIGADDSNNRTQTVTIPNNSTSYEISNLEENQMYLYRVKAHSGSKESTYSNAIIVDLNMATGISCNPIEVNHSIYTTGNEIIISTQAGKLIQLYSIDGLLRNSIIAEDGETRITTDNGIYIVRIDNSSTKVVIQAK